jgi:hopanoid biosynthesis associated protein HpnK
MTRKVIINADDFGLCRGVNEAVAKAHTEGVLTSSTIMVNMPCADQAVELAKSLPNLGVGVHLNLTEGCPVSENIQVKPLCDPQRGLAFGAERLCFLSLFSKKVRVAIKTELSAQVEWLMNNGIKPTHLDSHKHIHTFPSIFPIVLELARRFDIPAIRWPLEKQRFSKAHWPPPGRKGLIKSHIIRNIARINRFQDSGFFKTSEFLGIAHTGRIDVAFLKAAFLYNSAPVVEIMTHPGFAEGLSQSSSRLVEQRLKELQALCSEQTKLYLNKAEIELVNYGQL